MRVKCANCKVFVPRERAVEVLNYSTGRLTWVCQNREAWHGCFTEYTGQCDPMCECGV